ncbi:MAG: aspartate aminotransferase family protein [Candidatus Latescibacterota bacterium]|nr:MAG: aspartate aminotransferase family protein [Candidatus Latescibacterota bacterium]
MSDASHTTPAREELAEVLELVAREAAAYLHDVDARRVRSPHASEAARALAGDLPERGVGAASALRELVERGLEAAVTTSGPRSYHFVIGGTTPAALGADWLASTLDQVAYAWVSSPLAVQLELLSLRWLRQLFELPAAWGGIMTTGATMANFVGLAAARQWWAEQQGIDVAEIGLAELPRARVYSSGYVHASTVKALAMLGWGRASLQVLSRDALGRLDVEALEQALADADAAPAILVGNAGEVNAGDFDPIATLADLAEKHGAWLHVDGAFGLFARVSPRSAHWTAGVERAHSLTVDGHKWLNVPYDCGFSFVADPSLLGRAFAYSAAYLPAPDDPHPNLGTIGPESSRRARALAVWATLRAYGKRGYRQLVETHLELGQHLARRIDEAPDLERLAAVPLSIVCFRFNPGNRGEEELNRLNTALGQALLEDGRVYAGTTTYGTSVALRPAIVNWRTTAADLDLFVSVVRELGASIASRS